MTHQDIVNYNQELVKYDSRCDIIEYVKHINSMQKHSIELSFMEELLSYIEQDTCCIPHTLLIKYGVFTERNASAHIKETLELYEMTNGSENCEHNIECLSCDVCKYDADYSLLSNVREQSETSRGIKYKKIYYLKPETFKFILMRSKCDKKYARYYLLLEKCIKYYHDYQMMYKDNRIHLMSQEMSEIKQINLDQSKQMEELLVKNDNQSKRIEELLGHTVDIKEKLYDLTDFSIEQYEQREIEELKVSKVLPDRINTPVINEYLLLFKNNNSYYVIRGLISYVKSKFKSLTNVTYSKRYTTTSTTDYTFLKEYANVPNARHLYRALQSYKDITNIKMNTFESSKTDQDVIDIIQEVFDLRLTIKIEQEELIKANKKAVKKVKSIVVT